MPDLPPRRAARTSGSRPIIGRLTPAIKALLIAQTAIFAFFLIAIPLRPVMVAHLALGPGLFAGEYWQLATSLFLHLDPSRFLYCVLGIWWAGVGRGAGPGDAPDAGAVLRGRGSWPTSPSRWSSRHLLGDVVPSSAAPPSRCWRLFVAFGRIYGRTRWSTSSASSPCRRATSRWPSSAGTWWSRSAAVNWPELAGIAAATVVGYCGAAPGGLDGLWDALKVRRLRRRYRVIDGGPAAAQEVRELKHAGRAAAARRRPLCIRARRR